MKTWSFDDKRAVVNQVSQPYSKTDFVCVDDSDLNFEENMRIFSEFGQ